MQGFAKALDKAGVSFEILDLAATDWIAYPFNQVDFAIHFPAFGFSSNHPLALTEVVTNFTHLKRVFPHLELFPDPGLLFYYNDKYAQHLFLRAHRFPSPDTLILRQPADIDAATERFGFPMIVKNRFGAGGDYVFRVTRRADLAALLQLSALDIMHTGPIRRLLRLARTRDFWGQAIRGRKMPFPFLSVPLLAQQFVKIEKDLKTVVLDGSVVEAHWRRPTSPEMWKMNIDGGGIGEWSHIPEEALTLSSRLCRALGASWLNVDLLCTDRGFLISEFSPVWHHYAYREKPNFVYKDDYNIPVPLDTALDLESMIVGSLLEAVQRSRAHEQITSQQG